MGWLTETARVVAVEHDAVWVEADRSAACGKCAARAGCGQGALSALLQSGKGRVRAKSGDTLAAASCEVGDEVVIQVPESTLLGGTLLIYGAPLLAGTVIAMLACALGGPLVCFGLRCRSLGWFCYPSGRQREVRGCIARSR